jgi:L-erythro-3,5-diaminohexanoate dehydrogenase
MKKGHPYGMHRVISPIGVLPQPATKIDNNMEIYDNEILINVQTLNVDSASFTQIEKQACGDIEKIKSIILDIVKNAGKLKNPVTGSGGMLIGQIEEIGSALKGKTDLKVGDKIATLVSLSLTPLRIDEILEVRPDIDQIDIKGKAILFKSGICAKIPTDLPENLALAVLDVAGAPAQTANLVKKGQTVAILGGAGKSGMLCLYEAMKKVGPKGKVICVEYSDEALDRVKALESSGVKLAHEYIKADCTQAFELFDKINEITNEELCDITINNLNGPNTEMSSILATKNQGTAYFFSMATDFTKATLGAEGVGKDITMIMGNGYTKGHDEVALGIMRECAPLRDLYEKLYA